jgi:hypothetical protein
VHTCIGSAGEGNELTGMPIFTNTTFVLWLFIKFATLCSVDILHCITI